MAFRNVVLPTDSIKVGYAANWIDDGITQVGDNLHELRFRRAELSRKSWTIEWKVDTDTAVEAMYEAFGTTDSFLFKPEETTDYRETAQVCRNTVTGLYVGDGTTATFQMQITRSLGGYVGRKNVLHPITGTVAVYVNAVLKTLTTHYTFSTTTGIIAFTSGNEPAAGAVVTSDFDRYTAVRFMSDQMQKTVTSGGANSSDRGREIRQNTIIECLGE